MKKKKIQKLNIMNPIFIDYSNDTSYYYLKISKK